MKFEDEKQEEDDELVGGAIKGYVKAPMETVAPDTSKKQFINNISNRQFASSPYDFLNHSRSYAGMSMAPTNNVPGWLHDYQYVAHPEELVRDAVVKRSSGKGADNDHPHIRHAVVHSLQKHPTLLRTYLNGVVRA